MIPGLSGSSSSVAATGGDATDPHWASVASLLHFEGSDASTTFTDSKGLRTWTANGNAQIDTAQFKFGASSGLFDGTGDYLTTAHDGALDPTGDWTYEAFVRFNTTGDIRNISSKTTGPNGYRCARNASNQVVFQTHAAGVINLTSTATVTTGTWYHYAATRSGNVWRLFLDGNLENSDTNATYTAASTTMFVGRENGQPSRDYNGWIDELRITSGVARYTSNFTVPTSAYPDS